MTQVGEGRGAAHGGPAAGDVLAGRYQLEQHVNTDRAGRQIWYGIDTILRRPVAVVVCYPGGPDAAQMMGSAFQSSRIVHPNLVSVYDAIDEQSRAYVVREWIDGASLRDHLAAGPLPPARAVSVAHAVAAAVAALHADGMVHGNIHPGTVLIARDGRVVVAGAYADEPRTPEHDVRAIGAVLYYALTGYWPHHEAPGPDNVPTALRDGDGAPVPPRRVRAGVPDHLGALVMDLLDLRLGVPSADIVAGELARLDAAAEAEFDLDQGPVPMSGRAVDPPPSGRRILLGVGALVVVGVLGLVVGVNWLSSPSGQGNQGLPSDPPTTSAPSSGPPTPVPVPLSPSQVRIVDPDGDREELEGVEALVDGDPTTSWRTHRYFGDPRFGMIKSGMGILIDLQEERRVGAVKVELATGGAVAQLRTGDHDPGATAEGDKLIHETYTPIGEPVRNGSTMVFSGFDPDTAYRYLLIWFTEIPPDGDGYRLEVLQVTVEGF